MLPLVSLLALEARAFAPTDDVYVGIEPHRVQRARPEVQAHLLRGEAWRRFAATDGVDWQARFDELTGTPRWMWGRGIPMDTRSSAALAGDLERLLERHAALLGFEPGTLALRSANHNERVDTWYVEFDVLRDPTAPTYRGGISARVKHGNLILLTVATAPKAPVTGSWKLDPDAAIEAAITTGPAPHAAHTDHDVVRQLLEREGPRGLELRRTFLVRTRTADPPGIWVSFVDAETGELLSVHNEVRFATGTVTAEHHARTLDGSPLVTSPVPLAIVETTTDSATTDALGVYSITDGVTYTTDLHGDYLDVDNADGPDAQIASGSPDIEWTDAEASQAEIDSYVFLHQVRDFALSFAPDVQMSHRALVSNVNIPAVCNAYYDGFSVNFFQAGAGCNNTGEIADVNYHEWGHGFHYWSLEAGTFDSSLSEGASDCMSFFMTGDSRIAPFFGTSGWAIRDVAPDRVYPDDYVANAYYSHSNGLIFGGAMWDLWDLLQDDLGEEAGTEATLAIFAGLLKGGPDIPGSYYEALVADDDNGNLADGTPHYCQIVEAFGRHGLGTFEGGVAFAPVHEPLVSVPAGAPAKLTFEVLSSAAECVEGAPAEATLHYRVNGREWKSVAATVESASIVAELPEQELGKFVEYWLEGVDDEGAPFQAPYAGPFAPYSTFVGDTIEIRCEDFEADDGGFDHELVDGSEDEGADDWMWGAPTGAGGDPEAAFSGANVWGNDLGYDGYNGQYQANKVNRLRSSRFDTLHYTDVFLSYRRWLNVEDGAFDQAVITVDDEVVWTNHASSEDEGDEHHEDRQWIAHAVDLGGLADQRKVRIAWEIHSDQGLEFGGWTIDDVCLLAPATPDNRLAITDFQAWDAGGPIGLSWTNPAHRPVERVVVVRKADGFPTAWDDGEIVVDLADPEPGEPVETGHLNVDGAAGHYAVYASDGTDWLSWTVEGWNAARVDANGGLPGVDLLPALGGDGQAIAGGGGCGCATPSAPAAAWLLAAPLLLLRRRR